MPEIGFFLNPGGGGGGPGFLERGFKFIKGVRVVFFIYSYESEIMLSERECRANPSEFAIAFKYTTKLIGILT